MSRHPSDTAIILTLHAGEIRHQLVLGTGGWVPPEEREVLDWMTLIVLMGWKVQIHDPNAFQLSDLDEPNIKWIIFAGDPDEVNGNDWERILLIAKTKRLLIITRAGQTNGWIHQQFGIKLMKAESQGNELKYCSQGFYRKWNLRKEVSLPAMHVNTELEKVALLAETCIAASAMVSESRFLFLSFHPGIARDADPCFTALLKHLLIMESVHPVAWFDWENTLILRMDDPGCAQAVHHDSYSNPRLGEREWKMIGNELQERNARMSLGYVPGWVDDGDTIRGELEIDGRTVVRSPGKIYSSPLVKYIKARKNENPLIYDYQAEFRGIQRLRKKGLVEAELHGYTHLHPDRVAWLNATDKYESSKWYREFGRRAVGYIKSLPEHEHPLHAGIRAFEEIFHSFPSTLIFPGEEFTNEALERAVAAGLKLIGSYYLGMRIGQQLCWNYFVCSPYLDTASSHWFDQEIPVTGYFHDFDLGIHGVEWFTNNLDAWQRVGAKYFIDYKELAHILDHSISFTETSNQYQFDLLSENDLPLLKPLRIGLHVPGENTISKVVLNNSNSYRLPVTRGSNSKRPFAV